MATAAWHDLHPQRSADAVFSLARGRRPVCLRAVRVVGLGLSAEHTPRGSTRCQRRATRGPRPQRAEAAPRARGKPGGGGTGPRDPCRRVRVRACGCARSAATHPPSRRAGVPRGGCPPLTQSCADCFLILRDKALLRVFWALHHLVLGRTGRTSGALRRKRSALACRLLARPPACRLGISGRLGAAWPDLAR